MVPSEFNILAHMWAGLCQAEPIRDDHVYRYPSSRKVDIGAWNIGLEYFVEHVVANTTFTTVFVEFSLIISDPRLKSCSFLSSHTGMEKKILVNKGHAVPEPTYLDSRGIDPRLAENHLELYRLLRYGNISK
jgi:hypothetical protein